MLVYHRLITCNWCTVYIKIKQIQRIFLSCLGTPTSCSLQNRKSASKGVAETKRATFNHHVLSCRARLCYGKHEKLDELAQTWPDGKKWIPANQGTVLYSGNVELVWADFGRAYCTSDVLRVGECQKPPGQHSLLPLSSSSFVLSNVDNTQTCDCVFCSVKK